jgi:hypothetical protein
MLLKIVRGRQQLGGFLRAHCAVGEIELCHAISYPFRSMVFDVITREVNQDAAAPDQASVAQPHGV